MSQTIDMAIEWLCELLMNFPLEWEATVPSDDEGDWKNEVRHRGTDVSICWDNPVADSLLEMSVNFGGNQVRLSAGHAKLVYDTLVVMMCNRIEMLPPQVEEVA